MFPHLNWLRQASVFAFVAALLAFAPSPSFAQRNADDGAQSSVEHDGVRGRTDKPRAEVARENPPQQYSRSEIARIEKRQRSMIDEAFAAFPKGPPRGREDEPRVFFLGVAAYAEQDVFQREVRSVRQVVNTQFGSASRSLLLINHPETLDTHPIANHETLAYALEGIAQRMNLERDVFVLYFTSHGLEEKLALSHGNLVSRVLSARDLARMIERSGIKSRVLILSACHSGSFIDRLKSEDALILAAARADRTSFGCSNERAWTFFGDALFNRALRLTKDFRTAFDQARELISVWEREENVAPSLPQISEGRRIRAVLNELAQRR